MSEFRRMIYGDAYIQKENEFNERLKEIEEKYLYWFQQRINSQNPNDHDRLLMHTIEHNDGTNLMFGFAQDSELPEEIRTECSLAFQEVWKG